MRERVVVIAAALEAGTGALLLAAPDVLAWLLLGASLSGAGIAVARLCGLALLSFALACWPYGAVVTAQSITALFTYNLLAALYLAYLGAAEGFSGYLLWPVCALHGVMTILLARPAWDAVRTETARRLPS